MKDLIIVKKWLAEAKARDLKFESNGYDAQFFSLTRIEGEDDQVGFIGEIAKETEKAISLKTEICDCMGNERKWCVWLPKSQIIKTTKVENEA